jgi:hypothetical protein
LLCAVVPECRPQSSRDGTYFVGSNQVRRGQTILMNSSAKIVLINKEDLDRVTMRFISKKPLSHSDEEIGIVSRELFNSNNTSEIFCQPDILKIHKSSVFHSVEVFWTNLIFFSPNVK